MIYQNRRHKRAVVKKYSKGKMVSCLNQRKNVANNFVPGRLVYFSAKKMRSVASHFI